MTAPNVIEPRTKEPTTVKANVARCLLQALSSRCKAYCILSGYDRLPGDFDTGIDFMVDQEDFQRLPQIIESVARETRAQLFQAIDHELGARAYFLGSIQGAALTVVQPDCTFDYRLHGRRWLAAGEVLAARRLHPNGFWIPSTAHEFAYNLIKRLSQRDLNRDHGYNLHRLYVEDRIECGRMIARFCPGPEGSAVVRMASANDWRQLTEDPEGFRAALLRSRKETVAETLRSIPHRALHFLKRIQPPAGCWIAFMGPEGCGESTVLYAVNRQFAPAFRAVLPLNVRSERARSSMGDRGPAIDAHLPPPRGSLASIVFVTGLWFKDLLNSLTRILPGVVRSDLVLSGRCLHDLLVDSRSIRYGGPAWMLRAITRLAPRPDLVVVLDVPPSMIRARRPDCSLEEAARQRTAYVQMAASLPSAAVVNAAQPPESVIHDVLEAVLLRLASRTQRRLRLS